MLADPDAGVQRAAAAMLGTLGERSEPVLAALQDAAASPDPSLQRAAARSLRLLRA
jgi:HEAT repeat protein